MSFQKINICYIFTFPWKLTFIKILKAINAFKDTIFIAN